MIINFLKQNKRFQIFIWIGISLFMSMQVSAKQDIASQILKLCNVCETQFEQQTASYILDYGEESLMSRAWFTQNSANSIDVQYFIWSSDNIGILASEALLSAAERGVKVRVIVDDLLIDADEEALLILNSHPNAEIKIYNPNLSVGVSWYERWFNVLTSFHQVNQRMHDKTVIFDNAVGITGGRNMADEYFDFDQKYNFRDRDILIAGKAVKDMTENFNQFWNSPLAKSVDDLFKNSNTTITQQHIQKYQKELHEYANNKENFEPEIKQVIQNYASFIPKLMNQLIWDDVVFISDEPGKNNQQKYLSGGGLSSDSLVHQITQAQKSILIQSPYLVMPEGAIELFKGLIDKGVEVRISTNSLASTDNIMAFSGYKKQRQKILEAGIKVYEFKPHPAIQTELIKRYPKLRENKPIFAMHAKSMVIDDKIIYIGTFNLDPRSTNLNTEVGVLIENTELADQLTKSIEKDILPENSWHTTKHTNPDNKVSYLKRLKTWFYQMLPLQKVL